VLLRLRLRLRLQEQLVSKAGESGGGTVMHVMDGVEETGGNKQRDWESIMCSEWVV